LALVISVLVACKPVAVPGDGQATISWSAGDGHGSPVVGYQVTPYLGEVAQAPTTFSTPATTGTVTGLLNGGTYRFTVAPITDCPGSCTVGTASEASDPVTIGVPAAPKDITVAPSATTATLHWTAPADSGSPITGYVITPYAGGTALAPQTFMSSAVTQTVSGLTKSTTYTFRVVALNDRGAGLPATTAPATTRRTPLQVALGNGNVCVLLADRTVKCLGDNTFGQLGDGTTSSSVSPVSVVGLHGVTSITGGGLHFCALLEDTTVTCWGRGSDGALGIGTQPATSPPVPVSGLSGVIEITAGSQYSCALLMDRTVRCWGYNDRGQLGDLSSTTRLTPVPVYNLRNVTSIVGGSTHTCALLADGTVKCWGDNQYQQLGAHRQQAKFEQPVPVVGVAGASAITAGSTGSCALLADASARCWGSNANDGNGDGTADPSHFDPVAVVGLGPVQDVTRGVDHTCAHQQDGTIRCWGGNQWAQLGNGTTTASITKTSPVGLGVVDSVVSKAQAHNCAVVNGTSVTCWGSNYYGQLGDGTHTDRTVPAIVNGL
jgi:alpha-tubulin suppressor-like RCC1 family protein